MLPLLCKEMQQICSERLYYELFLCSVAKDPRSVHSLSDTELQRHFLDVANLQHVSYGGADYYCCPVIAYKMPYTYPGFSTLYNAYSRIRLQLLGDGMDRIAVPQVISPTYAYRYYVKVASTVQFVFDFKIPYSSWNFSCVLLGFFVNSEIPLTVQVSDTLLRFSFSRIKFGSSVDNDNGWHRVSLAFKDFDHRGFRKVSFKVDNKWPEELNFPLNNYALKVVGYNYTYGSGEVQLFFGSPQNKNGFEIKNLSALKKSIPAEEYIFSTYNISSGNLFDLHKHWEKIPPKHKRLWRKENRDPPVAPPPLSSNHVVAIDGFPLYIQPNKEKNLESMTNSLLIHIPTKNFAKYGIKYQ